MLRQHRHNAINQICTVATSKRLFIKRRALGYVMRNVCNVYT